MNPKSSNRFPAERQVLDHALANGGATYTLDTPGQAIRWRQRAYYFRKLLYTELVAASPTGVASTPYDALVLRIRDDAPCVVRIEIESPRGIICSLSGEALATPEPADDLERAAAELKKRLIGQ